MSKNIILEMKNLSIEGNVIDNGWIENLRYDNGKPNMNAIMILSEIVYWYKPTLVRDEITGEVKGYKKKFKADKLQKSYEALGDRIGISKRQAKACCDFLKKKGLITVEFREIVVNGRIYNNVMFVEPVVENLKKITGVDRFLEEIIDDTNASEASDINNSSTPPAFECNTPPAFECNTPPAFECNTPPAFECKTNTKNTNTETTNTESISISSKGDKSPQAIRFESIMGKKLGVTTLPRFEEHIKNLDADLVEAILVYAEETGARSYQWFEDRVSECENKGIVTGEQFSADIEAYRNKQRQAKNRAIRQKEEKRKAIEEAHERDMAIDFAIEREFDELPDVTYDAEGAEDINFVKEKLRAQLSETTFNVWFSTINLMKKDGLIIAECPNNFTMQLVESRYVDMLYKALELSEISGRLVFTVEK